MALADDIADLLATDGLSSTVNTGELTSRQDIAVVVVPTAGEASLRTQGGVVMERRRVQVRARGVSYPAVESLMASAHGILDGAKDRTINGTLYYWIEAVQPPFYLGLDDNERPLFTANYQCLRAAST